MFITLIDNKYHIPIRIEQYNVANTHLIAYNHIISFSEVDSILIIGIKFKYIPEGNFSLQNIKCRS